MLASVLVALSAFVFVGNQVPIRAKPDFSGSWTVQSGLESWGVERLTIVQTASSAVIQVTKGNGVKLESRTYRLDGNRTESSQFPRVYWIGDALAIDTTSELEVYAFDR